ncbi:tetratricopeptide repeat protein [candidate division CSSED10-310 bacterium]|uniref:Tetratricopeptide repeat protein n=1 Tax=candidate division CSSED10-310 bacterium TaxID=2855610 RepID=A0ABV6YRU5_UNCC1
MKGHPHTIGPYRLLKILGEGMGVVYLAEEEQSRRRVALKTIRISQKWMLESIRREIHALSRIKHPGIVQIFEEGVHEGLPWYTMELLEGVTLRKYHINLGQHLPPFSKGASPDPGISLRGENEVPLSEVMTVEDCLGEEASDILGRTIDLQSELMTGSMSQRITTSDEDLLNLLSLIRRFCLPLAYLHGEGIVHRDLKPDNILILADGRPVMVDFGLIMPFDSPESREQLWVEYCRAGTVHYTAPEQISGRIIDARADLYALGCILYEIITGHPPFVGSVARLILNSHLMITPPPPSRFRAGIPKELDDLVMKLLVKNPRDRLGYADAVAATLKRLGAENSYPCQIPKVRSYLYRPRFSGRERELDFVIDHLENQDQKEGKLILIGGEIGVGKTRLLLEVARQVTSTESNILIGECSDVISQPLQAFRKPLQIIADLCLELGEEETNRLLGRRGKLLAFYEPSLLNLPGQQAYPEPQELPTDAALIRLYSYLAETLAEFSLNKPTLLIIDDLQWADDLSLDFLKFLLKGGHLKGSSLLIAATYRVEEIGLELKEIMDSPFTVSMIIKRLTEEAITIIVGDMLALAYPPPLFTAYITRQSEGNPFFVAEYLRAALDEKLLWRDQLGQWQIVEPHQKITTVSDYDELPLPRTLIDLVARRLQCLHGPTRSVADAGAVIGREFNIFLLKEMTQLPDREINQAIKELQRQQIFEEVQPGRFRFTQNKIKEAAYNILATAYRRKLHLGAAKSIEHLHHRALDLYYAVLAYHYKSGGEKQAAAKWYKLAAERASKQFAHDESIQYLTHALDLIPVDAFAERYSLLLFREGKYNMLGHRELQQQDLHSLLQVAEQLQDTQRQAKAALRLANYALLTTNLPVAISEAKNAISLSIKSQDKTLEAEGYLLLGQSFWRQKDLIKARKQLQMARSKSREIELDLLEAACLRFLGYICVDLGDLSRAKRYALEASISYEELGKLEGSGIYNLFGIIAKILKDFTRAQEYFQKSLIFARDIEDRMGQGQALHNIGSMFVAQGDYSEAQYYLEQALTIRQEISDRHGETLTLLSLGETLLNIGDFKQAHSILTNTLALCNTLDIRHGKARTLINLATIINEWGYHEQARENSYQALLIAQDIADVSDQAQALINLGHAYRGLKRVREAEDAYQKAFLLKRDAGQPHQALEALAGLACISFEVGNLTESLAQIDELMLHEESLLSLDTDQNLWIHLTCFNILQEHNDTRAQEIIKSAYKILQERAGRISDEKMQQAFLEQVACHQQLIDLYQQL